MVVYIAVIIIVSILEIRQMIREGLKKEIALFIPLAMVAIALAWLYIYRTETSISAFFLKSFGILY
jgi:hypothetical protein